MALLKEEKTNIIKKHRLNELDTGSSEVQIALLTTRILQLTEHFKKNKKDNHSRNGLVKLVAQRKKLLEYLSKQDFTRYSNLIAELGLRK